ncbi:SCP-like protein [Ancylostoma ceylanicum]|uniref:SCP-like protein n=1 Tax=Ancylostoma ceylanicum TaxID=53326 RepID=A0A0D6M8M4_9BILA|nr:SCP-like protein [Ancylostoma ceylanicum]
MHVGDIQLAISLLFAAICSHAKATTAFGCKNSLISDEWREAVLSFHNKNRRKLAEGGLVDSKNAKMDVAKDMQKLYWDCNMEDQAWQKVKDCPTPPTTIGTYGVSEEVGADPNNKIYDAGAPMCDSCAQTCTEALCPDKPDPAKDLDTAICGQANLDKMSDDLRNTALDMHNYNRRLLATGWAEDKQIGYAKTAAKMPVLKYSCQLENDATTYTAKCTDATENADGAENFWSGNYQLSKEDAIKKAIEDWWSPLEKYGVGEQNVYEPGKNIDSYAKMAYEEVKEIGCGVTTCAKIGKVIVDCRYDISLTDGDTIYTTGVPCKGGCSGKGCSPLGGLCNQ